MATTWQLSKESMFVVSAFLVLFMSGGLILGFGPVYSMFVRDKLWTKLCTKDEQQNRNKNSGVLCAAQEIQLQSLFSTAFLSLSASNVVFGVFLDVVGPRGTIVLGLLLSTCGNFALAFSNLQAEGSGSWIIAGYSCIAIGGMGAYLAAFQISQLFTSQGVVCSTLSSLFNCSGFVYVLLGLDGVTRTAFFCGYGIVASVCTVAGYLLFPTDNIRKPRDFLAIPLLHFEVPRINTPAVLVDGMQEMLQRQDLWLLALLFGWVSLIFAFVGGAIPSLLVQLARDDTRAASVYTDIIYPIVVNSTFCYSPIIGYVIDHYGFKMVFVACIVLVQLLIALLLVPSLQVQFVTFIVFAMAQSCLYALQFAYIIMCFPAEIYGTLQAFLATISFSFGLLNYVVNPWTQRYLDGDYTVVLVLLGLPTFVCYAFLHVVQDCEQRDVSQRARSESVGADPLPEETIRLLQAK
ncbi:unnamed protein product [Hyaloperonospora brassicae]|uniref:Major facilitator superfamily (MFS) profile domain-containing protein n=1 Tax=Hyaloperonospora brassicae TaxID=162125 RepID=A0AAV0U0P5_HYABA|nr:unnamed protein product [Hyaloperonospora brassicae]